jgi:hypothetical protein
VLQQDVGVVLLALDLLRPDEVDTTRVGVLNPAGPKPSGSTAVKMSEPPCPFVDFWYVTIT